MKTPFLILILSIPFILGLNVTPPNTPAGRVYIPTDLEDCFVQLDSIWNDSTKAEFRELSESQFVGRSHFSTGLWMRNKWKLWKKSRLARYFNDLGIFHPDDMSGIILTSYHRRLLGKDILLHQQIEGYQLYWKVSAKPTEDIYPEGARKLKFDNRFGYKFEETGESGCVHVQTNSSSSSVWIYDYHFGWKLISNEELQELSSSEYEGREATLRKIYAR